MKIELNKHDRICFLGDSVTQHGHWVAEIAEFFIKNLSELKIGIYNCGISGSRGYESNLKNRLFCDCFNLFPKYTVIMFGMNDIEPYLYCEEHMDKLERREMRVKDYPKTLNNIISLCEKVGTIPIICSPMPYDEYNEFDTVCYKGADEALKQCAKTAKQIAEEKGLIFVDIRSVLFDNIKDKPVNSDRIHPNKYGHHLMAERFLYAIGAKEAEEPQKTVELSQKNEKRFEIEQKIRHIMFVERDCMGWQHEEDHSLEERKALIKKQMEESDQFSEIFSEYLEFADFKEELKGELIKQTIEMYY